MGDASIDPKHTQWPRAAGYEELEPRELEVSGTIPPYCLGTLYRNGVGPREFKTSKDTIYRTNHWFDCLAQVHRFRILQSPEGVKVIHNSRRTCDGLLERVRRTGKRDDYTFAAKYDPCTSFFNKLQSVFQPQPSPAPNEANIGVTLSPNFPGLTKDGLPSGPSQGSNASPSQPAQVRNLVNKTDSADIQALDPDTLEPLGVAKQTSLHPDLTGAASAAHAKTCPQTGAVFNFNLDFGATGTYRAFTVDTNHKTTVLATFSAPAAYLHSTFLTENYYVVCVWNSRFVAGGAKILWSRNYLDAMRYTTTPALWFVIRRTGGLVATLRSEPFFAFHTINAYEDNGAVVADVCAYDNMDVLQRFYLDNLTGTAALSKYAGARAHFRRFRLDLAGGVETVARGPVGLAPELPSVNGAWRCRKYRFAYGVTESGTSGFLDGLVKYDVQENCAVATWSQYGHTAGEPIFIADPAGSEEDDGVLMTVVLDGMLERSYLLVLSAKDLKEVGRATMVDGPARVVGFGFHGAHVAVSVSEGC